jgi:hypothetical protein
MTVTTTEAGVLPEPGPPSRQGQRRRPVVLVVAAAALVAAGTLTAVVATGGGGADAAVASAVANALDNRTATYTMSGSVGVLGASIGLSGHGAMDFTHNLMEEAVTVDTSALKLPVAAGPPLGATLTEQVVNADRTMYLNLGDVVGRVDPGKSWVSLDLSQLSDTSGVAAGLGLGSGTASGDPMATLRALAQKGSHVTDLGPDLLSGVPVERYKVSLDEHAISSAIAQANLPAWMRQAVSLVTDPNVSYIVDIDQQGHLRLLDTMTSLSVAGLQTTTEMILDFANFGAPVSVTVPPASEVVPYQTFLHDKNELDSPGPSSQ